MKKFLAGLLVGLLLATAMPALAAQYQGYDTVKVFVNGQEVQSDVPAIIIDGRTMVPLRVISEALGAKVTWDGQAQIEGKVFAPVNKETIQNTIQDVVKRYRDRLDAYVKKAPKTLEEVDKYLTENTNDLSKIISAWVSITVSPEQEWTKEGVQLGLLTQAIASEAGFWGFYRAAIQTGDFSKVKSQAVPMSFWKGLLEIETNKGMMD